MILRNHSLIATDTRINQLIDKYKNSRKAQPLRKEYAKSREKLYPLIREYAKSREKLYPLIRVF